MNYTQCHLKRDSTEQVAWIQAHLAKKGKTIKIKENGVWSEGWLVTFVGTTKPEKYVLEFKDVSRTHRKVTDI